MDVTRTWRKLPHGTQVYLFRKPARTHQYAQVRDGVIYYDESDDNSAAFGPAIQIGENRMYDAAGASVYDSRAERDAEAENHRAEADAARVKFNSPSAREERDAKEAARNKAKDEAQIRREIDKMNDVLGEVTE